MLDSKLFLIIKSKINRFAQLPEMEFKNHKIKEAVCAFRFNPSINIPWDPTYLGEFYNQIKDKGFSRKEEIRPLALKFEIKPNTDPQPPLVQQGETQMVFRTEDQQYAILVGNNYISFHTLNHYPGWDVFKPEKIESFFKIYQSLGLGKALDSAQMIYINNFAMESSKDLSDYLSFVPKMQDFGQGDELSHLFQSNYRIAPNKQLSLKTIFNATPEKRVILESNCIASSLGDYSKTWDILADDAHANARNAFIKISTDYFKTLIK